MSAPAVMMDVDAPPPLSFSLLSLPLDVLLVILQHSSLGPCELCRLEQTCRTVHSLIDDEVWRAVFLQHRRPIALREPVTWKQEYAKRYTWSRSWRHLATASPTASHHSYSSSALQMRLATQKLRRFALKMMSGSPGAGHQQQVALVVDPAAAARGAPGVYPTISAALAKARPFETILVEPGSYRERLRLEKPVEIVGLGPVGAAALIGVDGPTIEVATRVSCRIAGLRIEQRAHGEVGAMSGAVLIKGGATVIVEECLVTSETGHCVVMQGVDSCGYVLHNEIHRGKGVGVLVCDSAKGVVEDNCISCNGRAGVAILSGGDPLVCMNKIYDGMDSGVLISERGRGRVEDNDIFGNRRAGVAILKEGSPLVKRNRIHDGRDSGVLVCENGKGSVVDNDIFANHMAGVAIGRGGASHVTGNVIRDGNGGSLCLSAHSRGLISANVIHQHPRAAMQVPEGLMSEVKDHNSILYSPAVGAGAEAPEAAAAAAAGAGASPLPHSHSGLRPLSSSFRVGGGALGHEQFVYASAAPSPMSAVG